MPIIDIDISSKEIERRKRRIEATRRFMVVDRVPVLPMIGSRYWLPILGIQPGDYRRDPKVMLEAQLWAHKWMFENLRTDQYEICIGTDFQAAGEASALGCIVDFPYDNIPWVREHWVKDEADLEKLANIDYLHTGIHQLDLEYRQKMLELLPEYTIRLNDGCKLKIDQVGLPSGTSGPFTLACDVMGSTQVYTDIYERADFLKKLLQILTQKAIQWTEFCKRELGQSNAGVDMCDDSAAYLSEDIYQEFALPFEKSYRNYFGGYCYFHMCGKTDHLLRYFQRDLQINEFYGFGFEVSMEKVKEIMGGKAVLRGNVNPMKILHGTPQDVYGESMEILRTLGPCGGLILCDGANIAPGSPIENINAMYEATVDFAKGAKSL